MNRGSYSDIIPGRKEVSEMKLPTNWAGLVRVSGEKQKLNESLALQSTQIELAVKSLGCDPGKILWYRGQEHTLSNIAAQERKIFRQLLDDAKEHKFDALMVAYFDRRGRNKKQNTELHETLKDNGIRFFVLTSEFDVDDPDSELVLDIHSATGQHAAKRTLKASIEARISKAEQGFYTGGRVVGRTFDKTTKTWTVDADLSRKLTTACKMLDKGGSVKEISDKVGMSWGHLYKILRHRAGSKITMNLSSTVFSKWDKDKGNGLTFTFDVPPLVADEDLLKRVIARFDRNREKCRAPRPLTNPTRVDFALQGFVRCGHCHYVLSGQRVSYKRTPEDKLQRKRKRLRNEEAVNYYYRHNLWQGCYLTYRKEKPKGGKRLETEKPFPMTVNAERLEVAALSALFREMDGHEALKKALDGSAGNKAKKELKAQFDKTAKVLADLGDQKARLIRLARKGLEGDRELVAEIEKIITARAKLDLKLTELEQDLLLSPTRESLKTAAEETSQNLKLAILKTVLDERAETEDRVRYQALEKLPLPERSLARVKFLTNAERRAIVAPLFHLPGTGVFVFKEEGALKGVIKAAGYPDLTFSI